MIHIHVNHHRVDWKSGCDNRIAWDFGELHHRVADEGYQLQRLLAEFYQVPGYDRDYSYYLLLNCTRVGVLDLSWNSPCPMVHVLP